MFEISMQVRPQALPLVRAALPTTGRGLFLTLKSKRIRASAQRYLKLKAAHLMLLSLSLLTDSTASEYRGS